MSFKDFSDIQYVNPVDTGETIRLGSFSTAGNLELQYIRIAMFIMDVTGLSGNENVKTLLYSESSYNSILYESEWASIANIATLGSNSWIGEVRTDYSRQNINKNITYYLAAQLQNYTRNGDSHYIGFMRDFPAPTYENNETSLFQHPMRFQIFGYS